MNYSVRVAGLAIALMSCVAHADDRQVKRVPYSAQDVITINQGPIQGHVIVTTTLKSAETGAVVGECHTLVYGYGTYDKIVGFSCENKK